MTEQIICTAFSCPYCGETIESIVDTSQGNHHIIEDCSVCCRPIELFIEINNVNQHVLLTAQTDTE
jgi:transcription elongation factor Elf1